MKRVFRLTHEQVRQNAIKAIISLEVREERPEIVTIEQERRIRSIEQNKMMWAILSNAALNSGIEPDELHEIAKRKFLGYREVQFHGQIVTIANSTARLKTHEFATYIERLQAWLTEEGLLQVW